MIRRTSITVASLCFSALLLAAPSPASALVIDLTSILTNSGYESDAVGDTNPNIDGWKATLPNATYGLTYPVVNPTILPLISPPSGTGSALTAPVGDRFIGVLNVGDNDKAGKLVHGATAGVFAADTDFEITIHANRGRLVGASSAGFGSNPASASDLIVRFFGWGAGSLPTINSSDNWSRTPSKSFTVNFTNWDDPGEWASQTFLFDPNVALSYVAVSIAGRNHIHDSYIAWDVGDEPTQVPAPATLLLFGGGLLMAGLARRVAGRTRRATP